MDLIYIDGCVFIKPRIYDPCHRQAGFYWVRLKWIETKLLI